MLIKIELKKKRMYAWNLTAKTIMHEKDWIRFFKKITITGTIIGLNLNREIR